MPPSPYEWVDGAPAGADFRSPYTNAELRGLNRTNKLYYSGKIGEWWGRCTASLVVNVPQKRYLALLCSDALML